jgi:hypothetical protein
MKTRERDQTVARLAIIGLAACSGSRGNSMAAGTTEALEAIERLGSSTDYRDISDADVLTVCNCILSGTIRVNDAMWQSGDDGSLLPRLARLAIASTR